MQLTQIGTLTLAAGITPAWSQEQPALSQTLTVGAYYADGDYGEETDTTIEYFPVSYQANYGKWGFQLLMSHLRVDGLNSVLLNIGGVTHIVAGTQTGTKSGLGDSIASISYQFDPLSSTAPFIDLRVDVKIPTADEKKSLGTGEVDYSVRVDLSQYLGNSVLFATLGYNFRGKSDLYRGLENSAFAQLGVAHPLSATVNAGILYDFREPATSYMVEAHQIYAHETHEISPYISWQISDRWSVTGLTSWGFTDASADFTLMGQLSYGW